MTVYALHRYTATADTIGRLEAFPSVERASVALQLRSRKKQSGTFYLDEDHDVTSRPTVAFPQADLTGCLLVWCRRAGQPRPEGSAAPEEVWRATVSGGVVRSAYDGDQRYELPPLTPGERHAGALSTLRELPPLTEEFMQGCDASWRYVLRDLVKDAEAEDAVLRVIQAVVAEQRAGVSP